MSKRLTESEKDVILRGLLRWRDEVEADKETEAKARRAKIDEINAQLRDDAGERYRRWLSDFEARIARHERLPAMEVEDYGRLPLGYVREDGWRDYFVWRPTP